ncbi:MAG: sensor histidine kinase [Oscillospiraceae bacterium]|nr:sensor histidine kinase [Oscillospiraceae bacterium]
MQELSLNILDIAQNSVSAGASLIQIGVSAYGEDGRWLRITIEDDGSGMDEETLKSVEDPFFTSRTTRKVGLGVPLFKQASESTGGRFSITSEKGKGTLVTATFDTQNIDCTPLGRVNDTVGILIGMNPDIDFTYTVERDGEQFVCDTREIRVMMDGVPLSEPEVVNWLKEFIEENQTEILRRRY